MSSTKLLGCSGENGDRKQLGEYLLANFNLYKFRNERETDMDATAHSFRNTVGIHRIQLPKGRLLSSSSTLSGKLYIGRSGRRCSFDILPWLFGHITEDELRESRISFLHSPCSIWSSLEGSPLFGLVMCRKIWPERKHWNCAIVARRRWKGGSRWTSITTSQRLYRKMELKHLRIMLVCWKNYNFKKTSGNMHLV